MDFWKSLEGIKVAEYWDYSTFIEKLVILYLTVFAIFILFNLLNRRFFTTNANSVLNDYFFIPMVIGLSVSIYGVYNAFYILKEIGSTSISPAAPSLIISGFIGLYGVSLSILGKLVGNKIKKNRNNIIQ